MTATRPAGGADGALDPGAVFEDAVFDGAVFEGAVFEGAVAADAPEQDNPDADESTGSASRRRWRDRYLSLRRGGGPREMGEFPILDFRFSIGWA
ncbi:MAG TPA: hypothetical protein PKX25_12470, partial [Microthrixaceae bacterium]|nr:hypothetical protein [Microthrixaceae bacterium]